MELQRSFDDKELVVFVGDSHEHSVSVGVGGGLLRHGLSVDSHLSFERRNLDVLVLHDVYCVVV